MSARKNAEEKIINPLCRVIPKSSNMGGRNPTRTGSLGIKNERFLEPIVWDKNN